VRVCKGFLANHGAAISKAISQPQPQKIRGTSFNIYCIIIVRVVSCVNGLSMLTVCTYISPLTNPLTQSPATTWSKPPGKTFNESPPSSKSPLSSSSPHFQRPTATRCLPFTNRILTRLLDPLLAQILHAPRAPDSDGKNRAEILPRPCAF
jgi:hypothetical protein